MDLFGRMSCMLAGHDWEYERRFRVCGYCGKLEKLP